ncbi:hypothetical protein OCU04_010453 [Sclerotinia nivalis]|uniref:Carrier domain-containing protein n=1 Tax=Sclerotinia nivalis TaxID=352851 RepID=A0A9X0DH36_9HELO|nr:hypothetical protein OCU04_010453 [Sclerotinia nivalis]
MASRGAKNMIVLSRRGSKNKYSKSLQEELKDQGVHLVTPACDIVNLRSLKTCLKTCSQHMPPIKGCIQAAVVMRDATFTKVSYEDWKDCLEPKVLGSWNLHQSLPQGMDFFLCLSSISGIVGRETQGCYAAGNTYLDSLAQFRILHGEKAVSIDLGIMEEDGMLAEDPSLMNRAKSSGALIPIYTAQLHALLDYYCNPTLPMLDCRSCQPLIGLEVPANLFAKNIDLPPFLYLPTFKHLFQIAGDYTQNTNNGNNAKTDISAQIASAASVAEAAVIVTQALMDRLSTSVGIPIDELRDDKPMHQHGVDSLLAIELRNWFAKKIGADVAIFDILGDLGIKDVAGLAARKSVYKQTSWADN